MQKLAWDVSHLAKYSPYGKLFKKLNSMLIPSNHKPFLKVLWFSESLTRYTLCIKVLFLLNIGFGEG